MRKKPRTRSSSSPGVRITTARGTSPRRISRGSSTATMSLAVAADGASCRVISTPRLLGEVPEGPDDVM